MTSDRSNGGAPAGSATQEAQELGAEAGRIAAELKELLGLEAELAKAEVNEATAKTVRGVALGVGALVFADMALIFLFLTLMFAIDTQLPLWAAALITTLVIASIAGILGLLARQFLRSVSFVPRRFIRNVKEDSVWARSLMRSRAR
jgi:uncharacterized membrane protein YqjE